MKHPVISVIMSVYNPDMEKLILAADSIIDQTYRSWELIIYDDGSDVSYRKSIKEIRKRDNRIRILRGKSNRGLAYGLNICIKLSKGRYIARMDDDDVSLRGRLQTQKQFLDSHNQFSWVGCCAYVYDDRGVWGTTMRPECPSYHDFLHSSPFIHPGVMFRREALKEGYRSSMVTKRCEDYELFMRLYSKGLRGFNIQECLLKYREDRACLKRAWTYSFFEMLIRIKGFWKMGTLNIRTIPYVFKPLAVKFASYFPAASQRVRIRLNKRYDCKKEIVTDEIFR